MTIIIFGLTLVTLLIFAAFVVDLGQVYVERRHDQNTADASTTSGAVELLISGDLQDAVDETLAKVDTDLGRTVAAAAWTACSDAAALTHTAADLSLTPATACISFSGSFARMRVRIPDQTVETSFGQIVGIDSFTSSAFAEVTISDRGGGALPFVVLAINGPGDQICLRTNDAPREPPDQPAILPYRAERELDPCNEDNFDRASGGRGTLLPYAYSDCRQRGDQTIVDAIILGVDHPLGVFPEPGVTLAPGESSDDLDDHADARLDGEDFCTTALPNSVEVDPGLTAQLLRCALVEDECSSGSASDGLPGRLNEAGTGASFNGYSINDTALWDYFVTTLPASAPSSCTVAQTSATEFHTRRAALIDCLSNWTTGELFVEAISEDERFAYVPRVAELGLCDTQPEPDEACSGKLPDHVHINNFSPIYMDGLYEHSAPVCDENNPAFVPPPTGPDLWAIHYPGRGDDCGNTGGGAKIHRISAVVLPCGALPQVVCDPSSTPPFPGPEGVYVIRLAR